MENGAESSPAPTSLDDVFGWFFPDDQAVVTWLLERQEEREPTGDLVEMGAYMGKSAIVIGRHLRPGETFTVCDLFGADLPDDDAVKAEQDWAYNNLTRQAFERNYLAFHESLPTVVQAPTSAILDHVKPQSCRFVHIDASHMYEHVQADIQAARTMLREDGIVVCDDFRSEHTPGTAAAVWMAVAHEGLRPICITGTKLYGTWGDPTAVQDELIEWLEGQQSGTTDVQTVMGHRLIRIKDWAEPPQPRVLPLRPPPVVAAPPVPPPARTVRPAEPQWWTSTRTVARELLPPVVARALRRRRSRARAARTRAL